MNYRYEVQTYDPEWSGYTTYAIYNSGNVAERIADNLRKDGFRVKVVRRWESTDRDPSKKAKTKDYWSKLGYSHGIKGRTPIFIEISRGVGYTGLLGQIKVISSLASKYRFNSKKAEEISGSNYLLGYEQGKKDRRRNRYPYY